MSVPSDPSRDHPDSEPTSSTVTHLMQRRHVLGLLAATGVGSLTLERVLAQQVAESGQVTPAMVEQAEWLAGLKLDEKSREETARALGEALSNAEKLRKVPLPNSVAPALCFRAAGADLTPTVVRSEMAQPLEWASVSRPADNDELAFLPVRELAALVRSRQVSSVELTRLYLERLHKYNATLNCVVTFTDDLAMRQAEQADREIAAGHYRGPLHGIPWGAKDLIGYPPFKTTWGAPQYKDQVIDTKATVAQRLDQAGAVLVAKLTLGALAMGDEWFGGQTHNPWDTSEGSSGSSAGSACATTAGLVGFALGSETLGSIVSPCRRCGTTGLRPTFGRVSRFGCMALAWSMDKIGPLARCVEDCALVFSAIQGPDGLDPTVCGRPFCWPSQRNLSTLRVGYFETEQEEDRPELDVLRQLGVQLIPIELPKDPPAGPAVVILNAEAAAAFDELLRSGNTEGLNQWPAAWREAQFATAVDYIRANRVRTLLMEQMKSLFEQVDLYVGGNDLVITNLTGHPTVVLPNGFRSHEGREVPRAITFTGNLFEESDLLTLAHAYQQATGYHLKHPTLPNS